MTRYRGFRGSIMQWCYKNRKIDDTFFRLQKSVDELEQLVKKKEKKKKNI